MKLLEFILLETTDEDRAIASLASTLAYRIQTSLQGNKRKAFELGKISDLVDTPLVALNNISIRFDTNQAIQKKYSQSSTDRTNGIWDPNDDVVVLNVDLINERRLKLIRVITHELRHALDDMKSEYRASQSTGYDTPRNKQHRVPTDDHKNLPYLASPSEINARFVEVLSLLTRMIERNYIFSDDEQEAFDRSVEDMLKLMDKRKILMLFPEKEKSKQYRRLISRGTDFITKELEYLKSKG